MTSYSDERYKLIFTRYPALWISLHPAVRAALVQYEPPLSPEMRKAIRKIDSLGRHETSPQDLIARVNETFRILDGYGPASDTESQKRMLRQGAFEGVLGFADGKRTVAEIARIMNVTQRWVHYAAQELRAQGIAVALPVKKMGRPANPAIAIRNKAICKFAKKHSLKETAERFGLSYGMIHDIVSRSKNK